MFRIRALPRRLPFPLGVRFSAALALILASAAAPEHGQAQTGRANITILEHDGAACRQEASRAGRDRSRGWYCIRGVVSHPAGIASVAVQGAEATLRPDTAGGTRFIGVVDLSTDGGEITVLVRASDGEISEGLYRLTPTPASSAYPDLQPFSLTNLRPRLLGAGERYVPAPVRAAGTVPANPPAAPADSMGMPGVDAGSGALTEDVTRQFITIQEPAEWSGVGSRGITAPGRRSVRVVGYASHPGGVASVEIDGRQAAIRAEAGGSYRFVGFVPVDSVSRDVVVLVRGRSGNPIVGRYPLNAAPRTQSFASREEAWSPASGFTGKRWAVVVGISAYQDTALRSLQYADADARAMYEFLRSPRAGGGGFPEENVKLLLNEQATYAEVRSALYSFLRQSTEDDQVIIYFAGHGAPDPLRPSDLYLLTYDTRAGQIPATGFPMREVDRAVSELYARHVVLITDACHSGGITGQIASRGAANRINDVFLAQLNSTTGGLAVFTASAADQVSLEDAKWGGGHGVFTYHLLQALEGAADEDGDQIVTLAEMMHWTMERVRRETQNSQIPSIGNVTYDRYLPMSIVMEPGEMVQAEPARPAAANRVSGPQRGPGLSPALTDSLARAREAVELFPASAPYRSRLGRVLLRAELPDEALQAFRDAVRLDPTSAEFQADLAMAFRERGDAEASLVHFQDAIRLEPQSARFHHEYGAALMVLERHGDAINAFRRAVRIDAVNPAYHASLGDALRRSGRPRDAVASLRTAVGLDGESPVFRRELALALAADGQGAPAVMEMQAAIRGDTANAVYHRALAGLLRDLGDSGGARAALSQAARIDSTNAEYRAALGDLLDELGMNYEAILEFRSAVRLDSANALYRYRHGMLLTRSNQADNALAELRTAVRLAPGEAQYRSGLGQALRNAGRPAEALGELIEATRLDASTGLYFYELAMLYTEAGEHGDALAALEQATRLEPGNRQYATALREVRRRAPR